MIQHSRPYTDPTLLAHLQAGHAEERFMDADASATFLHALQAEIDGAQVAITPNGRLALYFALKALALPRGTYVVISSYVCESVLWAIEANHLTPRFCDLAPGSWSIDANTVAAVMDDSVSALILSPVFGFDIDIAAFRRFERPIIADLCQNIDQVFAAQADDDLGDFFVLSFHPTKMLPCGYGGAIGTRRAEYANAIAEIQAGDFELPWFAATQGLWLLEHYPTLQERRQHLAAQYLSALPAAYMVRLQQQRQHWRGYRLPLWHAQLDVAQLREQCAAQGVAVRRGVDALLHRKKDQPDSDFPATCAAFQGTCSIPFYPALSDAEQAKIISVVETCLQA